MTPHEQELRDALAARSDEVTPQFAHRVRAALARPEAKSDAVSRLALAAAVALGLVAVGGLLVTQRLIQPAPAGNRLVPRAATSPSPSLSPMTAPSPSPPAAATPTPQQVSYPTNLMLSASPGALWAFLPQFSVLYRSTDGGGSWEPRPVPTDWGIVRAISFIDARNGWLLAAGSPETQCNSEVTRILRTSDGGATWQELQATGIGAQQCKSNLDFVDSSRGFLSANDPNHPPVVYRTLDGGRTWAASTPLPDAPGFKGGQGGFELTVSEVRAEGSALLVAVLGHAADGTDHEYVYRSLDGGATWAYAATVPSALPAGFITATHWLALSPGNQSVETTDAGAVWHAATTDYQQAAPVAPEVVFVSPSVGYATITTRGGIDRTTDGGLHWTFVASPGI